MQLDFLIVYIKNFFKNILCSIWAFTRNTIENIYKKGSYQWNVHTIKKFDMQPDFLIWMELDKSIE